MEKAEVFRVCLGEEKKWRKRGGDLIFSGYDDEVVFGCPVHALSASKLWFVEISDLEFQHK